MFPNFRETFGGSYNPDQQYNVLESISGPLFLGLFWAGNSRCSAAEERMGPGPGNGRRTANRFCTL